jgi:phosphohistidine swiveling domain-containing protein
MTDDRWITDTPLSRRFPVYTRSNANDVPPDPPSPLGATISWTPGVMEGWRDGNVRMGSFGMDELTAEGLNPVRGFINGYFHVNASVVRVFGERSGAGAAGVDAAFFGNRADTPPDVARPDNHSGEAAARIVRGDVAVAVAGAGDVLIGATRCSGTVQGRARVVLNPSDPDALEPGDVPVAPQTDPSWTPLFVPAAAVVVDVGTMDSDVTVSRELGIPCAVSVADATQRIPGGAMVEVDGATGTVTLL